MIRIIKRVLNDRSAESSLFTVSVCVMIFTLIFSIFTYLLPVYSKQQRLDNFASELVRSCELDGSVDCEDEITRLKSITGLDPNIRFEYDSYKGTKRVQLNGNIKVICEYTYSFKIWRFDVMKFKLRSIGYGKSEVYYKS